MNKTIDLNNAYMGIYNRDGEYRIGLFVKTDVVVSVKNQRFPSARYYQDVLSDTTTALRLNDEGKDRFFRFTNPLLSDEEKELKANWKGIRGALDTIDAELFKIPIFTGSIDKFTHLIQFTSVYPDLTGRVSAEKVVECLTDYCCSKLDLTKVAEKQILGGLKEVPQYLLSQGSQIPTFENIQVNTIDLSEVSDELVNDRKVKR